MLHTAHPFRDARRFRWVLAFPSLYLLVVGCGLQASDETTDSESSALCQSVQLSSDATGPVTGNVTLTASGASCQSGETPEYRFVYRRDGTTALVELQNWSAASSVTWNTTGSPSGSYHVIVYARSVGSVKSQSYDSALVLVGQVCNALTLSSDLASPQSVGAVLNLTAAATCTGGTPEYQFTAKSRSGSSFLIRDWSSSATASWNTLGVAAGPYTIYAATRAHGNLVLEAQRALPFALGETCATPTLATTPSSPGDLGADVTLSASTTCTGAAAPQFRFSYRPSAAKTYTVLQDWSAAASATWHTTGLPADNYAVVAETRANDYAGPSQARKLSTFVLGPSCSAVTLVGSPKSPPALGALLTFTANSSCSGGSPEYRFSVQAPGSSSYDEFRGWGPSSATFPTSGLPGGAYAFKVETRGVGSVARYQAQRAISYDLGGVCEQVSFVATPPSPSFPATNVLLSAGASCINGGVPEYQFAARAVGATAWTILRDWSGSASTTWDTSQPPWNAFGDYALRVSARGQGQLGPAESTRNLVYSLTNGCVESSTYDLSIHGSFTDNFSGDCSPFYGQYDRTLHAVVAGDSVQVTGEGFEGTYPIVERTAAGFTARAGELWVNGTLECGNFLPGADNSGSVSLAFNCAKASVTFNASCESDYGANGCFPDYFETATGSGSRNVDCQPGYRPSAGKCVDINECTTGTPCAGAETCTNTPGSFSCSCDLPAKMCGSACVKTDTDLANCGACGNSCGDDQSCNGGACVTLTCPSGYHSVAGVCVDVDECAGSPSPCDPNATCTNFVGSYICSCKAGFVGNGATCTDLDECANAPCNAPETCTNVPGSYTCSCSAPAAMCNDRCTDLATNETHCGACGHGCPTQQACVAGVCVPGACPGTGGPSMVALPEGYCIDSTEVTRGQYAAWLATSPSTAGQSAICAGNRSFTPQCATWSPTEAPNRPVDCVDWCDAAAYCKAVGKRLCHRVGGGTSAPTYSTLLEGEWYNACSSHDTNRYVYGNSFSPTKCNGAERSTVDASVDVGSLSLCQSPTAAYSGVFDLNGNLAEWEDRCDQLHCFTSGGNFSGSFDSCSTSGFADGFDGYPTIGFRCCGDL